MAPRKFYSTVCCVYPSILLVAIWSEMEGIQQQHCTCIQCILLIKVVNTCIQYHLGNFLCLATYIRMCSFQTCIYLKYGSVSGCYFRFKILRLMEIEIKIPVLLEFENVTVVTALIFCSETRIKKPPC